MEAFQEQELRQGLSHFARVWGRVQAAQSPKAAAERCGVRLMPKQRRISDWGIRNCKARSRGR